MGAHFFVFVSILPKTKDALIQGSLCEGIIKNPKVNRLIFVFEFPIHGTKEKVQSDIYSVAPFFGRDDVT